MPPTSHQPPSRVSTDESTETELVKGNVVKSGQTTWIIDDLLGQGGFGAVYRVYEESNPSENYAMKIEQKSETRPNSQLKMEIAILKVSIGDGNAGLPSCYLAGCEGTRREAVPLHEDQGPRQAGEVRLHRHAARGPLARRHQGHAPESGKSL